MRNDSLPFSVSLDKAVGGEKGPTPALYAASLEEAGQALVQLVEAKRSGALELLTIVDCEDDLAAAADVARHFAGRDVFVLGIGGSSLGGQALADLVPRHPKRPRKVEFFDNPDPVTFTEALDGADMRATCFVAISKSGGTAETLMQTLACADVAGRAGAGLRERFVVVTEDRPSPLHAFADSIGCPLLAHPLGIGGRYSVLSVVGLFPALLMGLDAKAVRSGARAVVDHALSGVSTAEVPCAAGAALHAALAREGNMRETVLWAYADRLKTFGPWWRQLWAESLGKDGLGSTPVAALGPVDQHSQLQLFLDGPGRALFTVMSTDTMGKGPVAPKDLSNKFGLDYLAGRHLGDLVAAEARATAETLAQRGRPVREIHVPVLDERALGALFMHFMLETIVMGQLMGVDPFDQPAVEEGKVLTRKYLGAG